MSRENLVIVRAGNSSLHPTWLQGPGDRNWDLVVSYFGDDPDLYRGPDMQRIDAKGPKWLPLRSLLEDNPHFLSDYRYVCFPDDDLATTKADLNRFFDICAEHDLELAQPSLTADSPTTHVMLLQNTMSRIRFTNFVEVMIPCFRSSLLRKAMSTFDATKSGWGIDWLWPRYVENRETGIAVIDEIAVHHTRPLMGPNYDAARKAGLDLRQELLQFQQRENVTSTRIEVHRVLWRSGRLLDARRDRIGFGVRLLGGYAGTLMKSSARWRLLKHSLSLALQPIRPASRKS